MIIRTILISFCFLNSTLLMSQNDTIPVITGLFTDTIIESDFFKSWNVLQPGVQINDEVFKSLRSKNLDDVSFELIMGTWCEDSQYHAPVMLKLAEELGIHVAIIGLNREKDCPFKSSKCKTWDVEYIPTLKVFRKGEEIGRIVENPAISVEQDILDIISK